ncbi:hypothetical protein GCM10011367_03050 [Marinicauda pacifica]|uniref:Entericidin A/B family lipoprotein n=1 Tax=Marinicauda pacifica TaxID=1133559 RepID=A0A4S2HDC6_9PROT|nr:MULTISPECIES: entericidin A/B family lipoprotein [Marinicauda]TGY93994.1 entericidin A/B family lipoprotein [Marinicauda pacifica]GGE31979.1 hypothetical protein GCM10011367_03050 [Marinicauda pacifica]
MPRIAALLASLFMLAGITACNTVEGAGEDVQEAGEAIEDAGN